MASYHASKYATQEHKRITVQLWASLDEPAEVYVRFSRIVRIPHQSVEAWRLQLRGNVHIPFQLLFALRQPICYQHCPTPGAPSFSKTRRA